MIVAAVANPPLTIKKLREYTEAVARMTRQLENSGHSEAAEKARDLYRVLARLLADRQADQL
jgi:hypothetical protein